MAATRVLDQVRLQSKADLQQAVSEAFEPLKERFTPGCAGLDLGATGAIHSEAIALMEALRVHYGDSFRMPAAGRIGAVADVCTGHHSRNRSGS